MNIYPDRLPCSVPYGYSHETFSGRLSFVPASPKTLKVLRLRLHRMYERTVNTVSVRYTFYTVHGARFYCNVEVALVYRELVSNRNV